MASAIVLVAVLFPTSLDRPFPCTTVELLVAVLAAALSWPVLAMVWEEGRINARGETMLPR